MSIDQIIHATHDVATKAENLLKVYGDAQFKSALTVGQIIKGRVLRHYEGGRYLIDFSGQEKVVDSNIILMEGSTIRGRVTAISDKVMLQRISDKEAIPSSAQDEPTWQNQDLVQLKNYLESINIELSAAQEQNLFKLINRSVDRQMSLLASIVLLKNKIQLSKDGLVIAESALKKGKLRLPNTLLEEAANYSNDIRNAQSISGDSILIIAGFLQKLLLAKWDSNFDATKKSKANDNETVNNDTPEIADESLVTGSIKSKANESADTFHSNTWLMNAQVSGAIAHRIATIPIWVNGKIVEIDIAMFSQNEQKALDAEKTKYQKIVLSLETSNIGRVNIIAQIVNARIKLSIAAEDKEKADLLSEFSSELYHEFNTSGWKLEEVKYHDKLDKTKYPATAVAEHIIRQDSLSRVM